LKFIKPMTLDNKFITGLGRVEFGGKEQTVAVGMDKLEKLLKIVRLLGTELDTVYITVENDMPLVLRTDRDSDTGILLAPRVPDK
jgi:hypothetical protein